MDFLDPEKKRAHKIRLAIGYVLMPILVGLATTILLYQAYGYGFDKNGQIIQNGLVFVSSTPNPADIYLNGLLDKATTDTRLVLPAGQYTLMLKRSGYRNWQRALGVEGGSVERFDYPFLFPTNLVTNTIKQYTAQPGLTMASPDHHWVLVEQSNVSSNFDLYDLNNRKLAATVVSVPVNVLAGSAETQKWQLVEWSSDNRHVLLNRQFTGGNEFILLDTQTPASSVNLTKTLNLTPTTQLTLRNKKFDQYYVYDSALTTLGTDTLTTPSVVPVLTHVLAYTTSGTDVILYVTDTGATVGKVVIRLQQGNKNVVVRTVESGSQYLLNITQYNSVWYAVAGAASEGRIYVYKDPVGALQNSPELPLVPLQILKVLQPNFLEFSTSARFVVAESGQSFAVYDFLTNKAYNYQLPILIDFGAHATWMDASHLIFASSDNKVIAFDYDDANQETLNAGQSGTPSFFDHGYQYIYNLSPLGQSGEVNLTRTALTVPPVP